MVAGVLGAGAGALALTLVNHNRFAVSQARLARAEAALDQLRRELSRATEAREDAEARLEWRTTFTARQRSTAAITATIRKAEEAFRLRDGVFALLLEDTTDAGATWTAERVRMAVIEVESDAVMWAGVACYPAHGLTTEEVLDRADTALDNAREWRQHRIEVAPSEG